MFEIFDKLSLKKEKTKNLCKNAKDKFFNISLIRTYLLKDGDDRLKPEVWLLFILLIAVIVRYAFFIGVNWGDSTYYCSDAHRVLNGEFYLGKILEYLRIMSYYPIAFFYSLFGVNNFSAALYPLLTSLGSIIVVFYLGKTLFNEKIGLLASFLLSIFPLNIIYATYPMPDGPIAFYCALSMLLFIKAKRIEKHIFLKLDKRKLLFLLSGVLIGISYLHKVTGAIILLFIVPYMIYLSIKNRKIDLDYLYLFLGFGLIFFLEGCFYYLNNGDFFTRYNVVSGFYIPGQYGINTDLMYYPKYMFNLDSNLLFNWADPYHAHYGLFYFFIIGSMIYIFVKKRKKALIPLFWFLILFLYLEFGSMQTTSYVPIHKVHRHLTVLTIPGLLCLSYFLIDFLKGKKTIKIKRIIFLFILSFLLITSLFYTYHRKQYLDATTYDIKETYEFTKNYPEKNIYCDFFATWHLRFHYKYENDEHITSIDYVNSESELEDSLVVLNASKGIVEKHFESYELPHFAEIIPPNWELVKIISGPKIDIWATYDTEIYLVH